MKINFKKLNQIGMSHLIVPVFAIVIIGGIGSYVAVKSMSHADAAVPNLTCITAYATTKIASGKYDITISQAYKNTGGGSTPKESGFTYMSNGTDYSLPGTGQYLRNIPRLEHGQSYQWSATYKLIGVRKDAWIDGFSQYGSPAHPGDSRYFKNCAPAKNRFTF